MISNGHRNRTTPNPEVDRWAASRDWRRTPLRRLQLPVRDNHKRCLRRRTCRDGHSPRWHSQSGTTSKKRRTRYLWHAETSSLNQLRPVATNPFVALHDSQLDSRTCSKRLPSHPLSEDQRMPGIPCSESKQTRRVRLGSHVRQNVGFPWIHPRSGERGYMVINAGLFS